MPVRLSAEVQFWIEHGLFEGATTPLAVARSELRDDSVLRRLQEALDAERV